MSAKEYGRIRLQGEIKDGGSARVDGNRMRRGFAASVSRPKLDKGKPVDYIYPVVISDRIRSAGSPEAHREVFGERNGSYKFNKNRDLSPPYFPEAVQELTEEVIGGLVKLPAAGVTGLIVIDRNKPTRIAGGFYFCRKSNVMAFDGGHIHSNEVQCALQA